MTASRRRTGLLGFFPSADSADVAESAAIDCQITLHLRQLLEQKPALVAELVQRDSKGGASVGPWLLAAARDAVTGDPKNAALRKRAACLFAWYGDAGAAQRLAKEAEMLDPSAKAGDAWERLVQRSKPVGSA